MANLIELIKAIAWPVVVVVVLIAFREQLYKLLEMLGQRVTKLSIFKVSFELATVPNPPLPPWSDPTIFGSSNLIGGYVTSTTIMELFHRISDATNWHYLVVDIGAGKRWLISRLFIFTVILRYMHGLKCVVFVETKDEYRRRLLGIAKPENVRIALAKRYPWLDQVFVEAWLSQGIPVLIEPLPRAQAEFIVSQFVDDRRIQIHASDEDLQKKDEWKDQQEEWEKLEEGVWEHTKWLDIQRVNEDLRETFYDRDDSQFIDSPETPTNQRNKAILHRQAPFVALVNDKEEFKGLVERRVFLDQVAARLGEES